MDLHSSKCSVTPLVSACCAEQHCAVENPLYQAQGSSALVLSQCRHISAANLDSSKCSVTRLVSACCVQQECAVENALYQEQGSSALVLSKFMPT